MRERVRGYLQEQGEDEVHRLRTAIRRYERAASLLPASVRKEKTLRRYRTDLRDLARLNNRVRDIDITTSMLTGVSQEDDVPPILSRLSRERSELIVPALRLARSVPPLPPEVDREKIIPRKLRKRFGKVTSALLQDMRSDLKVVLRDPDQTQALHSLRIESKDLRYTLELAIGVASEKTVAGLAEWQDSLGRIRDIDVLTGYLSNLDASRHLTEFVRRRREERRRLYLRFNDAAKRSHLVAEVKDLISGRTGR